MKEAEEEEEEEEEARNDEKSHVLVSGHDDGLRG